MDRSWLPIVLDLTNQHLPPSFWERLREREIPVMLDRFVFRRDGGAKSLPENKTTAASSTCIRVPFRVSLDLVPPPSTSRFYLEWPGGPNPDHTIPCQLVAAHRDCVLFRLTSIVRSKTSDQDLIFPDDYYVYRPTTADLKRLPTCIRAKPVAAEERDQKQEKLDLISETESSESSESESGEIVVTEEMEWAEKVHREHYEKKLALGVDVDVDEEVVRSSLVLENIGFLCGKGVGDFIVAELLLDKRNRKVSAQLSVLHSDMCKWVHMPLPIQCNKNDSATLRCFCSQTVVPFGDSLCWVDQRSGIIIGKHMLEENPKLYYIPLPRMTPSRLDDKFRSVCATNDGSSLKFVDVVVNRQPRSTGFTILFYKLIITEEGHMKWEKETSMTSDELWGLKAPARVPHEVPMFPLVSLDKPHIVHFQLSECTDYIDTVTLVVIDMSDRTVVSVFTHIKGEKELHDDDADVAEARASLLQPFLPAVFPEFLFSRPVNLRKRKDHSGAT